jgi:uncharacterized membrane protein YqjE
LNSGNPNGRSLVEILSEMKDEFRDFILTRLEILVQDLKEKGGNLLAAIPLVFAGVLFLSTAFLLFSFALAALIAVAFAGSPYRWFLGTLIVGVLWSLAGAIAVLMARRNLTKQSLMPERTLQVLKGDRVWLQNETRQTL